MWGCRYSLLHLTRVTSRASSSHCCVTLEEGEIFKYGTRLKTSAENRDATRAGLRATWSVFRRDRESSWACCVMTAGVAECIVVTSRSSSEISLAPDKTEASLWMCSCFYASRHAELGANLHLRVFWKCLWSPDALLTQREGKKQGLWQKRTRTIQATWATKTSE